MHRPASMNVMMAVALGWLAGSSAMADVTLPPVFSTHMVLQQGRPVPVFGTATPGEAVTVRFRGQRVPTVAGPDGRWRVTLGPLTAAPDQAAEQMVVEGANRIVLDDVLVGEVWLGSGQSNMAWSKGKRPEDLAAANHSTIRLYSDTLYPTYQTGGWLVCTPETAASFSSLLFYFGVDLQRELKVPVGLIATGVGGTAASLWISDEAFMADPQCRAQWEAYGTQRYPALQREYEERLARWQASAAAAQAASRPAPKGKPSPPRPPKFPEPPGGGEHYQRFIVPLVGYGIRGLLWDQGEAGSGIPGVELDATVRALIVSWRSAWGQGEFPMLFVQKPSGGGWTWRPGARDGRGQPVPRPALPGTPAQAAAGAESRAAFLRLQALPNATLVVAADLNGGLHPEPKDAYGARAATTALGAVYGRPVAFRPPVLGQCTFEGGQARLRFKDTGGGLTARGGGAVQGFALAGEDRQFSWAEARIDGEAVVLQSPAVRNPVAVRYAWSGEPRWANLFGASGLPVLIFRTDDWPAVAASQPAR